MYRSICLILLRTIASTKIGIIITFLLPREPAVKLMQGTTEFLFYDKSF